MVNKNMLATLLPICCHNIRKDNQNNTINTICSFLYKSFKLRNTNNIDNIVYTNNTKFSTTCGSGKKYKNCCGKNAQHLHLKHFTKNRKFGDKIRLSPKLK